VGQTFPTAETAVREAAAVPAKVVRMRERWSGFWAIPCAFLKTWQPQEGGYAA